MSCGEDEQLSDFGFFAMSSLNISSLSRAEVGNFDLEAGDFANDASSDRCELRWEALARLKVP